MYVLGSLYSISLESLALIAIKLSNLVRRTFDSGFASKVHYNI